MILSRRGRVQVSPLAVWPPRVRSLHGRRDGPLGTAGTTINCGCWCFEGIVAQTIKPTTAEQRAVCLGVFSERRRGPNVAATRRGPLGLGEVQTSTRRLAPNAGNIAGGSDSHLIKASSQTHFRTMQREQSSNGISERCCRRLARQKVLRQKAARMLDGGSIQGLQPAAASRPAQQRVAGRAEGVRAESEADSPPAAAAIGRGWGRHSEHYSDTVSSRRASRQLPSTRDSGHARLCAA
ncbi:uncharacterized protein BDZ99DRAFT_501483 [Mytilinidion resinicola]|uniref:Uncharacterized protein n=1 Tax=Mytilinidion resinicola TaxID=574789 RepID=A0A6A6YBD2_9PEZI|nr:uncharacterized protein BDZ99DRAFT_501483 [Mytilinidion resinicola]KAF2805929.1 hypothetical protein BDZ99DRAFT_501483 [Mytilinidion resinicola]